MLFLQDCISVSLDMNTALSDEGDGIMEGTVCRDASHKAEECPARGTVRILDGKYKPLILWYLENGTMRFSEVKRLIPEATPRLLTKQLRELERDGLVRREVFPEVPPHTEYSLTDLGSSIIPLIGMMSEWGLMYMGRGSDPPE